MTTRDRARHGAATLASAGFLTLLANAASAQEAPASAASQPAGDTVEEVVVTGFRSAIEKSLETKRESVTFVDSISAEDVGKLPDNNLAEAISRVPGVQISRTNGEGQQLNLRGLGPSFARVVLDGMPISVGSEGSVDQQARNREFDFDLLPSELFGALEVEKSARASVIEGGISGTVNLKPLRPFDREGFRMSYALEGTYASSSEAVDPRASVVVSNTWGDKFGALLNVTYSERSYRTDGWSSQGFTSGRVGPLVSNGMGGQQTQVLFAPPTGYGAGFDWNLPSVTTTNPNSLLAGFVNESGLTNEMLARAQSPRLGRPEVQLGNRDRLAAASSLQFRPTEDLNFTLDMMYANLDATFDRYTNNMLVRNTNWGTNTPTGFGFVTPRNLVLDENYTITSGDYEGAKFWSENRLFINDTKFNSYTLSTDWQASDNLSFGLKLNHAESDWNFRMNTYLLLSQPTVAHIENGGGSIPTITTTTDLANINNWQLDTVRIQPRKRHEENETAMFDVKWGTEAHQLNAGLVYNTFYRKRHAYSTSVSPLTTGANQPLGGGAYLAPFGWTGPTNLNEATPSSVARVVPVNFGEFFDADPGYQRWAVADLRRIQESLDQTALDNAANIDFRGSGNLTETTSSVFTEYNFKGEDLRLNVGARYVRTELELHGFFEAAGITPMNPLPLFGVREAQYGVSTIEGEYNKWLPSLNVAYDITDTLMARFSAARTMTRPDPTNLLPSTTLANTGVVTQGNPNLAPFFADQFDLGADWYFTEGAVLSGNLFHKNITGFIETVRTPQPFRNAGIPIESLTDPSFTALLTNGYDTILLFQQPQNTDTPVKMKGFELLYQQRFDFITQGLGALFNYTRLDSGESTVVGLARDNYNATIYFERPSFAARLSYNWRSDYIECTVNCFATEPLPQYRQEAGYLDLSTSYNFEVLGQKLSISLEGLNLTDEVEYAYFGETNRAAVFNQPGRTFLLGIRGTF